MPLVLEYHRPEAADTRDEQTISCGFHDLPIKLNSRMLIVSNPHHSSGLFLGRLRFAITGQA